MHVAVSVYPSQSQPVLPPSSCKDVLCEAKVTEFLTHLAFWSLNLYSFLNATAFITDRYMTVLKEKHIFEHVQCLYWSPSMRKPPTLVLQIDSTLDLDQCYRSQFKISFRVSISHSPSLFSSMVSSLPFLFKYFSKEYESKENCQTFLVYHSAFYTHVYHNSLELHSGLQASLGSRLRFILKQMRKKRIKQFI